MDDLSSLDWNSKSSNPPARQTNATINTITPSFRATPPIQPSLAGLTPQAASRPSSSLNASKLPTKSVSPANDSFANLLSINSAKNQNNLTLQDRQKQLLAERQRQIQEQQQRQTQEARFWDQIGTGKQAQKGANGHTVTQPPVDDEEDILAAFSSAAKVDKSSRFPPPISAGVSGRSTPATGPINGGLNGSQQGDAFMNDDDDPFGLGAMPQRPAAAVSQGGNNVDDDDILGDLGRPVSTRPQPQSPPEPATEPAPTCSGKIDPLDKSMAELVDMGFPAEKAKHALIETNCNLQAAVSWLLTQAHEESRQKSGASQRPSRTHTPHEEIRPSEQRRRPADSDASVPAWMRQESRQSSTQRHESPAGEKDVSQYAQEFGTAFFKSANSLWKQGQKKAQKALTELQQQPERDSSQPKWMRDASADGQQPGSSASEAAHRSEQKRRQQANITDEAALLESGASRPQRGPRPPPASDTKYTAEAPPSRGRSPAQALPDRTAPQQRFPPQSRPTPPPQPTKLNRQIVEEEAAQAYVSSARRRKPQVPVVSQPEPEVDLFSPAPPPASRSQAPTPQPQAASSSFRPSKASTPAPVSRPQVPIRTIPSISPSALSTSAQHRAKGTEAFKRGDYDTAHQAYTAALTPLPPTHPITIVVLCNHALTAIKTGEPKTAVSDADKALELIGPTRGDGEMIDLQNGETPKDMKEFYTKALSRKAEALEAMEKWSDAATVWRTAVEAGVGGLVAVRGRDRCEKAANPIAAAPKPKPASAPKATPVVRKAPAGTMVNPAVSQASSAEAVKRLRAANLEAEKADDEKFALADVVHARIEGWKGGKSDNLRALLGSLDTVLWPEAGWKKVGMAELVLPNKVKIVYMKAIAKVHPDKVSYQKSVDYGCGC